MALLERLQVEVAKKRIKHLEHLAFIEAGKEISPHLVKAQVIRKKYGLENWVYQPDY